MKTKSDMEPPGTPAEEKCLDLKAWEREWMAGNTEWWPDTINLPGDDEQVIRSGCPSSAMPKKAQERIQKLRDAGEPYVSHVGYGVHAYRIGLVTEYIANTPMQGGGRGF